jgi:hypothetical protein
MSVASVPEWLRPVKDYPPASFARIATRGDTFRRVR